MNAATPGDPACFAKLADLSAALARVQSHGSEGVLSFISRRVDDDHRREELQSVRLTPDGGMPLDAWATRVPLNPEAQLAVMQTPIARMIANGQSLAMFGDQLFIDLDLSKANLPIGSTLKVGEATLTVTPKPHNGCKKFKARFGEDALDFVVNAETRHLNLRGIYLRVLEPGEVKVGDRVTVIARSQS